MRHFVVLRKTSAQGQWQEFTVLKARTRRHALRRVEDAGVPHGAYIAVPLVQWRVMSIPLGKEE